MICIILEVPQTRSLYVIINQLERMCIMLLFKGSRLKVLSELVKYI